jgi:hypothetical protein
MRPSTRGQAGAAILVALIAGLIVLYILFLPPEERAALLGDSSGTPGGPGGPGIDPTAIVYSSPVGRVTVPSSPNTARDLATVPVRAVEEGTVLARRDTLVLENNAFEKRPATVVFATDPKLTRNTYLSMNLAGTTGGRVVVTLNGEEVYNQAPRSRSIPPIALDPLVETNVLEFSTSTVGFAFWRTNRATLTDVKVTGDVTDLSTASVTQRFTIGKDEYERIEIALLSFVPICTREGPLVITLNGVELVRGVPDCETLNTLEIAPTRLVAGENAIGYSTDTADLLIDRGRITTTARREENRQFSFAIDPARVAGRPILLRVLFADASEKSGYVVINGNRMPLSGGASAGMPITTALRAGSNTIAFEAVDRPFEIVRFEIVRG